jgi:hypothetical protein
MSEEFGKRCQLIPEHSVRNLLTSLGFLGGREEKDRDFEAREGEKQ